MTPLRLVPILALLALPRVAAAKPPEARDLDDAVAKSMKAWPVPGAAVVIVQDDKVVYLKGHGVRESGKKGAVTPDTLFALGSCGKAFTTAAMAMLVDDGKLTWDDRVRDHLPAFRLSDDLVTRDVRLRDLVCHRTGLASNDLVWFHAPWSPEEGVERLAYLPLAKPFRTAFQYNSVTFRAAGLAAARANKTTWQELIRERVLLPLGMKRTALDADAADKDADRARPHRLDRAGDPEPFAPVNMKKPDPAGSVHSSARDLGAWLRFHLDEGKAGGKRLVSARSLRQTHTPQIVIRQSPNEAALFPDTTQVSYAMAWVVLDHKGHKLLAHGGALDGQRAQIILVPEKKLGIAVLSNLEQTAMNLALSFTLLEMMLEEPKKRDWNELHRTVLKKRAADAEKARRERLARRRPDTKPSREAAAYVGLYEHKAFGTVRIRATRDGLVWDYRGEKLPLRHFHYDTFLVEGELAGDAEVVFALDDRGDVSGFTAGGHFDATFSRARDR